jgi:hypothetical protein
MILTDLRGYLQTRRQASLSEIALHFDADPEVLRGMLEIWVRKGRLLRQPATAACGGSCRQCDPASTEFYVWVDGAVRTPPLPGCSVG